MTLRLVLIGVVGNVVSLAAGISIGWFAAAWRAHRQRRRWSERQTGELLRQMQRESDAAGFLVERPGGRR